MNSPDPGGIELLILILEKLRRQPPHKMRAFKEEQAVYDANTHQGTYVITDPSDKEVVYIGKTNNGTKEKGVADRIWGHLAKGSDLQSSLGIDVGMLGDYNVRTIDIADPKERGLAELFGIAVYAPRGNRYGYKGIATDLDHRTPAV